MIIIFLPLIPIYNVHGSRWLGGTRRNLLSITRLLNYLKMRHGCWKLRRKEVQELLLRLRGDKGNYFSCLVENLVSSWILHFQMSCRYIWVLVELLGFVDIAAVSLMSRRVLSVLGKESILLKYLSKLLVNSWLRKPAWVGHYFLTVGWYPGLSWRWSQAFGRISVSLRSLHRSGKFLSWTKKRSNPLFFFFQNFFIFLRPFFILFSNRSSVDLEYVIEDAWPLNLGRRSHLQMIRGFVSRWYHRADVHIFSRRLVEKYALWINLFFDSLLTIASSSAAERFVSFLLHYLLEPERNA